MVNKGRGWNVEADIKPLVAPSSPAYPWLGKQHSFWGRMQLWVSQAAEGKLDSKIIPVVLRHLQQEAHDVELEGIDVPALRAQLAVNKIQQQAARQHQARQSSEYQQWLEAATSGGIMKGLYSAIRTTVRPYRNLPLELRPLARRAAWMSLWQPAVNVDPNLAPALASLQQQAIRQSQLVGPVSAPALRKVVKKLSTKAPGLDGLASSMLKKASDAQLQELSEQIADWEQQGSMPGAVLTTAVAMLKPDRKTDKGSRRRFLLLAPQEPQAFLLYKKCIWSGCTGQRKNAK